jgi:bifunctional non-homologous end joining protein LigD
MSRAAARPRKTVAVARVEGVKSSPFPGFIEPCLATLRPAAPTGAEWLHEIKLDGYRTQAHIRNGRATIYTRRGYDWTDRFSSINEVVRALPAKEAILDGEVVVLDDRGASDFHRLQEDLAKRRSDRLTYFAFDLLYLDGFDLRSSPLVQRKQLLAELLQSILNPRVRLSEHIEADGLAVFEHACSMRLEGIVSKQRDSPYRSGRQELWLKSKCTKSDSYPIVAFVEKLGANPRRIASLYLGRREGERLLYAGKVRTGYTDEAARHVREYLDPYVRPSTPLSVAVKKPKATWVEPIVEAEVAFSGITADGLLREAAFKGLREDLAPPRTSPASAERKRRRQPTSRGGVPKENILQLLPDAVVPTKEELAAYWSRVAERALPYLARRPLKLVRHTRGTTFYHMGPLPPIPASVHQLKIRKRQGGEGTRLWIENLAGLLGLLEIGAIELHPWNSTVDDIEHPDTVVFDLDPGEGISWGFVIESALAMREILRKSGHESWPKLTGGKGIHIMVPIEPKMTHDAAHSYAGHLAQQLAATAASRYTLSATMSRRKRRLFIDFLRNGRGTTAVGTYSPRARHGFPIAAPVTWRDIESGVAPDAFTLCRMPPKRVGRRRSSK